VNLPQSWGLASHLRILSPQTVEAVVREVGSGKVGLRLSPYSWEFNECYELDGVDATIALNVYLLKELNKFNLAYVHIVSARIAGAPPPPSPHLHAHASQGQSPGCGVVSPVTLYSPNPQLYRHRVEYSLSELSILTSPQSALVSSSGGMLIS
jgi:hypothetical protein